MMVMLWRVMAYFCLAFVLDYMVKLLISEIAWNDDASCLRFLWCFLHFPLSGSQADVFFYGKLHEKHGVKSAVKSAGNPEQLC